MKDTFPALKREKLGLAAAINYLKKRGFERIEKSRARDHDLDAWKEGVLHPIEVKARGSKMITAAINMSLNEYKLFKSNPNALLIRVHLDKVNLGCSPCKIVRALLK